MAQTKKEKSVTERIVEVLESATKLAKQRKVTSGALIAALLGGVLKLTEVTKTFPPPSDLAGNIIIFFAVLIIAADTAKGGLLD